MRQFVDNGQPLGRDMLDVDRRVLQIIIVLLLPAFCLVVRLATRRTMVVVWVCLLAELVGGILESYGRYDSLFGRPLDGGFKIFLALLRFMTITMLTGNFDLTW